MSRIETAVQFTIDTAKDNKHGYSQPRRKIAKSPAEALLVVDGDCATDVLNGLVFAGFKIGGATYTGNMLSPLLAIGFKNVASSVNLRTGAGVQRGDILLRPKTDTRNGHTAFCLGKNKDGVLEIVQAQSDYDGKLGDSSGREISIKPYYDSPFRYCLRYTEPTYVEYSTHVESIGWMPTVADNEISGTTGQSLRVEAIRINLKRFSGGVQYSTHLQDVGWGNVSRDGQASGSTGLSRRLEAIKIELTGPVALTHDIVYQVHVQDAGWQEEKRNGEVAGTTGESLRIEAIKIKIVEK